MKKNLKSNFKYRKTLFFDLFFNFIMLWVNGLLFESLFHKNLTFKPESINKVVTYTTLKNGCGV